MREDTVDTANGTDYSALIGDLVNDAKKIVENSFDWTALQDSITLTTTSGTSEYSLTGSGDQAVVKDVMIRQARSSCTCVVSLLQQCLHNTAVSWKP